MLPSFKEGLKSLLFRYGLVINRTPAQFDASAFRLQKLRDAGFRCQVAVDGGAADGRWTSDFHRVFPESTVLCVEPRDDCQPKLREAIARVPHAKISQMLLGPEEGVASLNEHGPQSSMLNNSLDREFGTTVQRPMTTLDGLIRDLGLSWPNLIKLDLQGAELLCLQGASESLRRAEVVILEVSFLPLYSGNPLIADVIPFMARHGFRCYDIAALWRRPLDNALAQGDFFFVKDDSPLVSNSRWSESATWS
jgi:FkbM family methyltransferase